MTTSNQNDGKPVYDEHFFLDHTVSGEDYKAGRINLKYKVFSSIGNEYRDKLVMDIGCGRGELVFCLSQKGFQRVIASDFSWSACSMTNQFLEKRLNSTTVKPMIIQMDAQKLSIKNETIYLIFALDVIEHLYSQELELAVSEIRRVMAPEGLFVVHTFPTFSWAFLVRNVGKILGMRVKKKGERYHVNEQWPIGFAKLLKRAGFYARIKYTFSPNEILADVVKGFSEQTKKSFSSQMILSVCRLC